MTRRVLLMMWLPGLCLGQTQVDYLTQVKNRPTPISDTNPRYATFAAACTDAVSRGATLIVGKSWTAQATASCAANLQFVTGGVIQPASGQTVTLSGAIAASAIQIFNYSAGGTLAITYPPAISLVQWWGALGDGATNNTNPIQYAINALCGSANPTPVSFIAGNYWIVGTISWATNNCTLTGVGPGAVLIASPSSANTDMISFPGTVSYNTNNGLVNLSLTTRAATNTRNIVSVANNGNFTMDRVRVSTDSGGVPAHLITMTGMISSLVHNSVFSGASSGTNDSVVVGSSGLTTSTTVTFEDVEVLNSNGAGYALTGSSSAATIAIRGGIIEGNQYGIKTATETLVDGVHGESNSVSFLLTTASAVVKMSGCDIQHSGSGPYYDFTGGGEFDYPPSNTTPSFAAGQILLNMPAGSFAYAPGPILPLATFPSGTLNSGSTAAVAAGVLASKSYTATGVSGAFTTQSFRGNQYNLAIAGGATQIHIGESSIGLPVGETITFVLTTNGDGPVTLSHATGGDYGTYGQINDTGRAANTFQVVVVKLDANGHFVIVSSPGWAAF